MCRQGRWGKLISFTLLAFGIGILMTFLLPMRVLVAIEALLLIGAGVLYLLQK